MLSELPPHEFQNQVLSELRQINTPLDKLESRNGCSKVRSRCQRLKVELNAYQKSWDGMVRMSTTIIITTVAAVIFALLSLYS